METSPGQRKGSKRNMEKKRHYSLVQQESKLNNKSTFIGQAEVVIGDITASHMEINAKVEDIVVSLLRREDQSKYIDMTITLATERLEAQHNQRPIISVTPIKASCSATPKDIINCGLEIASVYVYDDLEVHAAVIDAAKSILPPQSTASRLPVKHPSKEQTFSTTLPQIIVSIAEINLQMKLPSLTKPAQCVIINVSANGTRIHLDTVHFGENKAGCNKILQFIDVTLDVKSRSLMSARIQKGGFYLPYRYNFAYLLDDCSNVFGAIKYLHRIELNNQPLRKPFINHSTQVSPKVDVNIDCVFFEVADNGFERAIERWATVGTEEIIARTARLHAFEQKVREIGAEGQWSEQQSLQSPISKKTKQFPDATKALKHYLHKRTRSWTGNLSESSEPKADPMSDETQAQIQDAWKTLNAMNARLWVKALERHAGRASSIASARSQIQELRQSPALSIPFDGGLDVEAGTLFEIELRNIALTLDNVEHGDKRTGEILHEMDAFTPASLEYDTLVPLHITLQVGGANALLREFATPFVQVGPSGLLIHGNVIITEHLRDLDKQVRIVALPLIRRGQSHVLNVERTMSLPKIYTDMKILMAPPKLHLSNTDTQGSRSEQKRRTERLRLCPEKSAPFSPCLQVSYGLCFDSSLVFLSRVFEELTTPSRDRSESLPYWDKMRAMIRGAINLELPYDEEQLVNPSIEVRILTERWPAEDEGKKRSAGISLKLRRGLKLQCSGKSGSIGSEGLDHKSVFPSIGGFDIEAGEIVGAFITLLKPTPLSFPSESDHSTEKDFALYKDDCETFFKSSALTQIGLELFMDIPGSGDHTQIMLRSSTETSASFSADDSWLPIRSRSFSLRAVVKSRKSLLPDSSSRHHLHLTTQSLTHVFRIVDLYSSVIASFPVRKGKLFPSIIERPVSEPRKPKNYLRRVYIKVSLEPLVIGLTARVGVHDMGVGVRVRCKDLDAAVDLYVKDFIAGSKRQNWNQDKCNVIVYELEGRGISWGNDDKLDIDDMNDLGLGVPNICNQTDESNTWDWEEDYLFYESNEVAAQNGGNMQVQQDLNMYWTDQNKEKEKTHEHMEPFVWAPILHYFRTFRHSETHETSIRDTGLREIAKVQIDLLQQRLTTVNGDIVLCDDALQISQRLLADAYNNSIRKQSEALLDRLANLYQKQAVLTATIHRQSAQNNLEAQEWITPSSVRPVPAEAANNVQETLLPDTSLPTYQFSHRIIIHNLRLLWNLRTRNISYKFGDWQAQEGFLRKWGNRKGVSFLTREREPINNSLFFDDGDNEGKDFDQIEGAAAQDLITHLLMDPDRIATADATLNRPRSQANEHEKKRATSPNTSSKVQSTSISPDYIPPGYKSEPNYVLQLINPQIKFETSHTSVSSQAACLIVAAKSTFVKSISVVDATEHTDEEDAYTDLVKTRTIVNIDDAQIFVSLDVEVRKWAQKLGMNADGVIVVGMTDENTAAGAARNTHLNWAPLECLVEQGAPTELLRKVVKRTSARIYSDKCNSLYVRRASLLTAASENGDSQSGQEVLADVGDELLHVDAVNVQVSDVSIVLSSIQYCAIYDIILNLLLYREAAARERHEQLERLVMLFSTGQQDLDSALTHVHDIQDTLRSLNALSDVNLGTRSMQRRWIYERMIDSMPNSKSSLRLHQQKKTLALQEEMSLLMQCLTTIHNIQRYRESVKLHWRCSVRSSKILWEMLQENDSPLVEVSLTDMSALLSIYEDQSTLNTIEVARINAQNQLPDPHFKELIAPYTLEGSDLMELQRRKMVRLYWREMAPVGGIAMFDHFEINIFPLLFQMTHSCISKLIPYLYPEATEAASQAKQGGGQQEAEVSQNNSTSDLHHASTESIYESSESTRKKTMDISEKQSVVGSTTESLNPDKASKRSIWRRPKPTKDDLTLMKDRANNNKMFVYIKVPGAMHCVSYKGPRDKNIEDLHQFAIQFPTFEYRNKTWNSLDLLMAFKKDATKTILKHTGSLLKEKFRQIAHRPSKLETKRSQESLSENDGVDQEKTASSRNKKSIKYDMKARNTTAFSPF